MDIRDRHGTTSACSTDLCAEKGNITPAEFFDLNFKVGGWKELSEWSKRIPLQRHQHVGMAKCLRMPVILIRGRRNMNRLGPGDSNVPARRTHGNLKRPKR